MPGKKTGMTRRGTSFKNTGADTDERKVMTATGELTEMLKTLLADRKTLEEELRLERQQRAEESAKRDTEMARQMDLLRGLVEGTRGEVGGDRRAAKDPKVAKLMDNDDIEAYLVTFERLTAAYEVPTSRWAFQLAPELSGKAQQAYAALSGEAASDYKQIKEAILRRYDVNAETYRQKFRGASMNVGETTKELRVRLEDLAKKWTKDCDTIDKLRDVVVFEQLLNTLPKDIRVWVQEHNPKSSEEAAQLANDYIQARWMAPSTVPEGKKEKSPSQMVCHKCKQKGHKARNCPEAGVSAASLTPKTEKLKRDLKDVICYTCQQKGHYSANCPSKPNLLCVERRSTHHGKLELVKHMVSPRQGIFHAGRIEGQTVSDVCLDTGSSRTIVRQDLAPAGKLLEGDAIAFCCAHGDTVVYPLARVEVKVDGRTHEVEAAVLKTFPMSMLMGTDVPALSALVTTKLGETALAVVTRAQAKAQEREEASDRLREEKSGVCPMSLEPEEEVRLPEFDADLFGAGREKVKLTWSQKRAQREEHRQRQGVEAVLERHGLEMSAKKLIDLQNEDVTLEEVRRAADRSPAKVGCGFFRKDGLLYRHWIPRGRVEDDAVEQLVLPLQCRADVVRLAHRPPFACHLGRDKTVNRLLQRFYWPTLFAVVVKTCDECQRTAPKGKMRAPLVPLLVITTPLRPIAKDIVGPLPRSRSGRRFVLVICDYATRFPEAIPMRLVDAVHVAEELLVFSSRFSVPQEILTDQGANFTSKLLTELYRMLHAHPIRTTPYHPQTDGLVERFNKTLKSMLRKAAISEGKDWDKMVPYLLFAYREVEQVSSGFSPFELVYGWPVRGPLDVLKEPWETKEDTEESVVSYVLTIQKRLHKMRELVANNLEKAQQEQK